MRRAHRSFSTTRRKPPAPEPQAPAAPVRRNTVVAASPSTPLIAATAVEAIDREDALRELRRLAVGEGAETAANWRAMLSAVRERTSRFIHPQVFEDLAEPATAPAKSPKQLADEVVARARQREAEEARRGEEPSEPRRAVDPPDGPTGLDRSPFDAPRRTQARRGASRPGAPLYVDDGVTITASGRRVVTQRRKAQAALAELTARR